MEETSSKITILSTESNKMFSVEVLQLNELKFRLESRQQSKLIYRVENQQYLIGWLFTTAIDEVKYLALKLPIEASVAAQGTEFLMLCNHTVVLWNHLAYLFND